MSRRAWVRLFQLWVILPFALVAGLPDRPVEVWQLIIAAIFTAVTVDLLMTPWARRSRVTKDRT